MREVILKIRFFSALLLAIPAVFGGDKEPIEVGHRFTIHSKVLDEDRTIMVGLPQNYEQGNATYPVLYMTDALTQFHHTVGTVSFLARNNRMPETIVVAVVNTDRTRDLTPAMDHPDDRAGNHGGADNFLKFFETELIPHVDKNYRTQPFRMFAGHSLGGLFSVYAFLSRNELFDAFIAVSPSLWWDQEANVVKVEKFLAGKKTLHKTLFLTLGNEGEQMSKPFQAMTRVLEGQNIEGFAWEARLMPDEDHGSVVLASHYAALQKVFEGWQVPGEILATGLAGVQSHYQKLSERMGYTVKPPENTINNLGYGALGRGSMEVALEIFEYNIKTYPDSANVYDSYAEALEKSGKLKRARKNYAKAYERGAKINDPNTDVYKRNLDRVEDLLKKDKSKTDS